MLGLSVPIYTNIHFPFTSLPLGRFNGLIMFEKKRRPVLMAPYVSSSNPTGGLHTTSKSP